MGVLTLSLVPAARRATSPPGVDLHPTATDPMFQGYIEDAFWSAVLKGFLSGYTIDVDNGTPQNAIVPVPPNTTEMPGQLGQLIVEFAALNIVTGDLLNLQTTFRASAGPASFEIQRSATVLVAVLKSIENQIALSIEQIGSFGYVEPRLLDNVIERTLSIAYDGEWWVI